MTFNRIALISFCILYFSARAEVNNDPDYRAAEWLRLQVGYVPREQPTTLKAEYKVPRVVKINDYNYDLVPTRKGGFDVYDSKSRQLIGFGFVCWGRSKEEAALEVFKMASLSTKLVVDYKREWNVALCKDRDVLTWQSGNSAAILSGRVVVYVKSKHGDAREIADIIFKEIKSNRLVDAIKRFGR